MGLTVVGNKGTFSVMNTSLGLNCVHYTGIHIGQNSVDYIHFKRVQFIVCKVYPSTVYFKSHK